MTEEQQNAPVEGEPEQEETVPDLPQVKIGGMVFSAEWSDDKPAS